ncbi:MAG: hypothetical protein O2917_05430, partial [Acidobacteria bacterium]|nr:hypothetical protein [Acidobacteriota bacterium]
MSVTPRLRMAAAAATGFCLLTVAMAAQQFVLSSQDRARLIAVDFTALGPDGLPVTDLTTADVTLRIDGRTRPITSLEYVSTTADAPRVPPPFGTNAVTNNARTVLLVIDDETLRPGRETELREDIQKFLA